MNNNIKTTQKQQHVRNTRTNEVGIFRSVWTNPYTRQNVVNVRVNGQMASWNVGEVAI